MTVAIVIGLILLTVFVEWLKGVCDLFLLLQLLLCVCVCDLHRGPQCLLTLTRSTSPPVDWSLCMCARVPFVL